MPEKLGDLIEIITEKRLDLVLFRLKKRMGKDMETAREA